MLIILAMEIVLVSSFVEVMMDNFLFKRSIKFRNKGYLAELAFLASIYADASLKNVVDGRTIVIAILFKIFLRGL